MYRQREDIENGMLLYDERDYWREEDEYTHEDYLADEADRQWKIEQEERLRSES